MADEKKTPAKEKGTQDQKQGGGNKFLNWIKALPQRIATPFRNMVHELKRVTWPSKQKTITYSIIVLVFIVLMMLIVGVFDLGSTALINLKPGAVTTTPAPSGSQEGSNETVESAPTKAVTVEATTEATKEATVEVTKEATTEATKEATVEVTEEATTEATKEAAVEVTEEATTVETEEAASKEVNPLLGDWTCKSETAEGRVTFTEEGWTLTMGDEAPVTGTWAANEDGTYTLKNWNGGELVLRLEGDTLTQVTEGTAEPALTFTRL